MRHKLFLFQVNRACESKLDEPCEFANAFGKWGQGLVGEVGSRLKGVLPKSAPTRKAARLGVQIIFPKNKNALQRIL
jgi:hypothetical protein